MRYKYMAEEYRDAIRKHRLDTPEQWMAHSVQVIIMDRTSETRRLKLPAPLPAAFAKIYRYPRWSDRLRIFFRGGLLGRSRGGVEFGNLRLLHRRGLAPQVIAYGTMRDKGLLKTSLLVTREVSDAVPLDTFAAERLESLTRRQRLDFIETLAQFTRTMNAGGFINTEYHWRNILVSQTGTEFMFQLIDPSGSRWWFRFFYPLFDVATLDVCAPYFFTRTERLRFLKHYWNSGGNPLRARQKTKIKKIMDLCRIVSRKELKRYRRILPANCPKLSDTAME
jgi:hypothetical protein